MIEELSKRQREVLLLRANGNSCIQIGHKLKVKPQTVYEILGRIYTKYGAEDAPHAVAIALAVGDIGIHEIDVVDQGREAA